MSFYAQRALLYANLVLLNATLMAQQAPADRNGPQALAWTRDDISDPMTSAHMARLTAVTPGRSGYKLALICGDESREASRSLKMMGSWAISLEIEPVYPRLKYKLHYNPPTTTVTLNQYFRNGPVSGTGTTSGGDYEAMPLIRIDEADAKGGGGDAGQIKFDFLAPVDLSRSAMAGNGRFSSESDPNESVGARNMKKGWPLPSMMHGHR